MKKIEKNDLVKISGGKVSPGGCMLAGGAAMAAILTCSIGVFFVSGLSGYLKECNNS